MTTLHAQGGQEPRPQAVPDRDLVVELSWCMNCGTYVAKIGPAGGWRHLLVNGRPAAEPPQLCASEDLVDYRRDGAE